LGFGLGLMLRLGQGLGSVHISICF